MKSIYRNLAVLILIIVTYPATAQELRISSFGQESIVFGDFSKKEFNHSGAGYIDYGSSGGLELNYYFPNKLGVGLRWAISSYGRDLETFENDLKNELNLVNNTFHLSQPYAFWTMNSEFGISYLHDMGEKWQIEPYFYLGFNVMGARETNAIYSDNGSTFQYRSESPLFYGVSYAPGVKMHWNIAKRFGLYFSGEYQGSSYFKDDETRITSSATSLGIKDVERSYKINAVNIGLGLSFKFGKGIE